MSFICARKYACILCMYLNIRVCTHACMYAFSLCFMSCIFLTLTLNFFFFLCFPAGASRPVVPVRRACRGVQPYVARGTAQEGQDGKRIKKNVCNNNHLIWRMYVATTNTSHDVFTLQQMGPLRCNTHLAWRLYVTINTSHGVLTSQQQTPCMASLRSNKWRLYAATNTSHGVFTLQ